jgi:hypothetical protein
VRWRRRLDDGEEDAPGVARSEAAAAVSEDGGDDALPCAQVERFRVLEGELTVKRDGQTGILTAPERSEFRVALV